MFVVQSVEEGNYFLKLQFYPLFCAPQLYNFVCLVLHFNGQVKGNRLKTEINAEFCGVLLPQKLAQEWA